MDHIVQVDVHEWESEAYSRAGSRTCFSKGDLKCMPPVLAGLLNPDPSKRSTCKDVIAFIDRVTGPGSSSGPLQVAPRSFTAQKRYALAIGNSEYSCRGFQPLPCSVHDAYRVRQELHVRGFEVTLELDVSRGGIRKALDEFIGDFKHRQKISEGGHAEV